LCNWRAPTPTSPHVSAPLACARPSSPACRPTRQSAGVQIKGASAIAALTLSGHDNRGRLVQGGGATGSGSGGGSASGAAKSCAAAPPRRCVTYYRIGPHLHQALTSLGSFMHCTSGIGRLCLKLSIYVLRAQWQPAAQSLTAWYRCALKYRHVGRWIHVAGSHKTDRSEQHQVWGAMAACRGRHAVQSLTA
jgi:hypothetical protein